MARVRKRCGCGDESFIRTGYHRSSAAQPVPGAIARCMMIARLRLGEDGVVLPESGSAIDLPLSGDFRGRDA